jgi:hypothetical protein
MGLMRLRAFLLVLVGLVVLGSPAGAAAAEGGCPNEALRVELNSGGLPDCRAYEMVTPTFKAGGASITVKAISADGSRVIAEVFGGFAGTEGWSSGGDSLAGVLYEFSRTGSGWAASAIEPPASRFPGALYFAASRDLTRTLWQVREPSQPVQDADLYVREADGRFVKLGVLDEGGSFPGGPSSLVGEESNPRFSAASADLSHVIMLRKFNASSSYEYSIGVAESHLIGLDGEGNPIGACGSEADAISSSGERVVFTAGCGVGGVTEVYAQRAESETVDVSEPSLGQCEECQTAHSTPPVAEASAGFQGASEDGSKVFFSTEQELLKGQTTANLYEFDFDRGVGQRVLLVSKGSPEAQVQRVVRVSADGSHVYFIARGVLAGNENHDGEKAEAGQENLYAYERDGAYPQGRVRFVAANTGIGSSQTTPDGRFLVFQDGSSHVFEYDAQEELLVELSAISAFLPAEPGSSAVDGSPVAASVVSSDGATVVFQGVDINEPGVFEYRSAGSIADGAVSLLDGRGFNPRVDASGDDVFFQTIDSLIPGDTNTGADIYDARVHGGFAEPPAVVGCEGDVCQGAQTPGPSFTAAGSSSAVAGGNLVPPAESKPPVAPAPAPRSLTRAQKLARALRACRKGAKSRRSACEARARKRYGSTSHAKQSDRRGK